ncbi:MAG: TonB-dependent receptor [Tannerellaceae bacterium]|nr:TonB-dependent receptor [Tannerellaceae bacterium]
MHIRYMAVLVYGLSAISLYARHPDTVTHVSLSDIVVSETAGRIRSGNSALSVESVGKEMLREQFTGNLMQALEYVPGVRSMDIGSGFSKPMIRGMGFNRVVVTENGIKQEGQQWGADHGLEIDAFHVEQVTIRKGPSSLLYGSDAMGGAIEITQRPAPSTDQLFGEVSLLGKSVNDLLGASLLMGVKRGKWYSKLRYSDYHFGDYRVPTDAIIYLTQRIPIYHNRLKNTAGKERDVNFFTEYRNRHYLSRYAVSNTWQKTGFFPGAHGIPDPSRVTDDGSSRNIELPFSSVNHLKVSTFQQYHWDGITGQWHLGYQNNRRQEWSRFHTHYGTQLPPEQDPDKELDFNLHTASSTMKLRWTGHPDWEHTAGWEVQYQRNTIGGYSFLLPEYHRFTTGILWLSQYRLRPDLTLSGGVRYDVGRIRVAAFEDVYLENYLDREGASPETIEQYKWRSRKVNRTFGDVSASLGVVWQAGDHQLVKVNAGRSFRLPGANELAANGVHHGTFRHEQGDPGLGSERGWQLDASYQFMKSGWEVSVTPFVSWFSNYIYLSPAGEWSILPHAGQMYRYAGARALFSGAEVSLSGTLRYGFDYRFSGEYVYTSNRDEKIPISFSPPPSMRHLLGWQKGSFRVYGEWQAIAAQNRVDRNEDPTPGAYLFHAGLSYDLSFGSTHAEITLAGHNLLNKTYYNHLSFYRKVEIPEPGRNIQLLIKVPFKSLLK